MGGLLATLVDWLTEQGWGNAGVIGAKHQFSVAELRSQPRQRLRVRLEALVLGQHARMPRQLRMIPRRRHVPEAGALHEVVHAQRRIAARPATHRSRTVPLGRILAPKAKCSPLHTNSFATSAIGRNRRRPSDRNGKKPYRA